MTPRSSANTLNRNLMSPKDQSPWPFHKGEVAIQERMGSHHHVMSYAPRVVRNAMPDQHRQFYQALPFLVVAARDKDGRMWSTFLASASSNMTTSPNPQTLFLNTNPVPGDALEGALTPGTDLGIVGIEFATKRRNRVNGRIVSNSTAQKNAITFQVDQSFGNCPQYIKPRQWWVQAGETPNSTDEESCPDPVTRDRPNHLSPDQIEQVRQAETIFLATGHRDDADSHYDARYGNDASHRGGPAGFVRVSNDGRQLILPDFAGNHHYNTIGNLQLDSRIGISFPQYETGAMLQVTGIAMVDFDKDKAAAFYPGAERLIVIDIDQVNEIPKGSIPIRWSSNLAELQQRKLVVSAKIRESNDVTSFHLRPQDHELQALWEFEPGQHLPIRLSGVDPLNQNAQVERTYSLSNGPGWGEYRISVKRQHKGTASTFLHDRINIGDVIQVSKPAGDFQLDMESNRPLVLLSNGIGVTPMISMLHQWAMATLTDPTKRRPVYWVHGARNSQHHPFVEEVEEVHQLVKRHKLLTTHVAYSQPLERDTRYDSKGRLTVDKLENIVPDLTKADVYMCGNNAFVADMEEGLIQAGVPVAQVHYETF